MSSLADIQARVRQAVTGGDAHGVAPLLVGGIEPGKRLAIHQRHYEASLVTALCEKFPASTWLLGADVVFDAAQTFVRSHPPRRPCIAEYGEDFPTFLAAHGRLATLPYVTVFAELEWAVGQVSIAVDREAVSWPAIARIAPDDLLSTCLVLQPGVRYRHADWPVDELMTMYLSDAAPDTFVWQPAQTCVEIRGARGVLRIDRVDPGTCAFRTALLDGLPIGDAAEAALDCDEAFDPGQALVALVSAELVTGVSTPSKGM
jgi:hypothetical protein